VSIRVMLVDDHNMVSEVLSALLARETDMDVVATTDNGREAVRMAKEIRPDVIVMDVAMPELNGIEACRQIMVDNPEAGVIILSMHEERRFVLEALKAGARGYIQKKSAFKMLVGAIRSVAERGGYLDPKITGIVVSGYAQHDNEPGDENGVILSPREREVLQMIAEGKNTKEIAYALDISTKTVDCHRRQVMQKLRLDNIADLTRYAIREGMTSL